MGNRDQAPTRPTARRRTALRLIYSLPSLATFCARRLANAKSKAREAQEIVAAFARACPLALRSSLPYAAAALELALRFERSVCDALYIALAVAEDGFHVTADERLVNAVAHSDLARFVRQLGSGPAA